MKALLLLVPLTLLACQRAEPSAEPAPSSANAAVKVRTAKVQVRALPKMLEVSGTLEARERSEVAAQLPAVVKSVRVDLGDQVKKGDLLVELDGRDAALRLAAARAQVRQAEARLGVDKNKAFDPSSVADVQAAEDGKKLAEREAARARELAGKGSLAPAELDRAESAESRASAQLEVAKNSAQQGFEGLSAARAQASLAAKGVGDSKVRAPFDGYVVERRVSPGEYAAPGRAVVVVVSVDPMRLRFDVSEGDVGRVALGSNVEVRVAAFDDRVFEGKVARIGASLSSMSRTLPVEADVPNPEGLLRPGFFARVSLSLPGKKVDTLWVPEAAVATSGGTPRVYVRSAEHVVEHLVMVLRKSEGQVQVQGDLTPDAEVAITNVETLSDGTLVTVVP